MSWAALVPLLLHVSDASAATVTRGGGGTGTYTLSTDAKSISTNAVDDAQGKGVTFTYNSTNAEYEYTVTGATPVTDTITGMTTVANSTNYTATLTLSTAAGGTNTSTITVDATAKDATPASTAGPAASSDGGATCVAGSLTWLICPVIDMLISVIDWIRQNILQPLLVEPPFDKNQASIAPVYQIWSSFRDVASIFFILVFFLVIFGTAVGFDNYSIKKILPHLVAGAILMPFSWYICAIGIDIGNIVGQGAIALCNSIIPTPAIDFGTNLESVFYVGGAAVAGILATAAISGVSIGLLITIVLAVLATFFTLVLRKILIILMVVLSPFAILAWVLPNTQKLFKMWWTNLLRLIMMYPLILMLFEAGRLFSTVSGTVVNGAGTAGVKPLFQLTGLFLPLGLVPWTFSMAGGALKFGQSGINKLKNSADNKWGKDSAAAKERHERFKARRAATADDTDKNAFSRAMARKQAGTGGFILNGSGVPIPFSGGKRLGGQSDASQVKQSEMGNKYKDLTQKAKGARDASADLKTSATEAEAEAERLRLSGDTIGADKKMEEAAAIRHSTSRGGQIENAASETKSKIVSERATAEGNRLGKLELLASATQKENEATALRAAGRIPEANTRAAEAAALRQSLTPGAKFNGTYETTKEKAIQDRAALGAGRAARAEMGAAATQKEAQARALRAAGRIPQANAMDAEAASLRSSLSAPGQFAGGREIEKEKAIKNRVDIEGARSARVDMASAATRADRGAAQARMEASDLLANGQLSLGNERRKEAQQMTQEANRLRASLNTGARFEGQLDTSREAAAHELAGVEGSRAARIDVRAAAARADAKAASLRVAGDIKGSQLKTAEARNLRNGLSAEGQFNLLAESQKQKVVTEHAALEGLQRATADLTPDLQTRLTARQLESGAVQQEEKIIQQRAEVEGYGEIEIPSIGYRGRLKDLGVSGASIPWLETEGGKAVASGNRGAALAFYQKMAETGNGRDNLEKIRREQFGGTDSDPVKDEYKPLWNQIMEKVDASKAPDLSRPLAAAFEDVNAQTFFKMDKRTKLRYLDYAMKQGGAVEEDAINNVKLATDPRNRTNLSIEDIDALYGEASSFVERKPDYDPTRASPAYDPSVDSFMAKNAAKLDHPPGPVAAGSPPSARQFLNERRTAAGKATI
jgi:hypothetical protein